MRVVTPYAWHTGKLKKPMDIAVVTDLHDAEYRDLWPLVEGADCLLVAGDVVNRYQQSYTKGLRFLDEAAQRLPTFFCVGNHEMRLKNRSEMLARLKKSRATFLFNEYTSFEGLWIGGWYRPELFDMEDMLDEFEKKDGCKVLLCHRPEDYVKRLKERDVDLVLAGHAHGGQVRIFGQGLYAPGQGLFPKYTKGVVDGKMIVSTGASNVVKAPRWGNPCEVVRIALD